MTPAAARQRVPIVLLTLATGSVLLGLSLARTWGDHVFYALLLVVAAVWAVGGLASGPLPWRPAASIPRAVGRAVVVGLLAGAVFVVGALIVREIAPLHELATDALDHAAAGNAALIAVLALLNAVAEEIFFRGAVYAALSGRAPVVMTTVVYVAATAATGNALLVFAAAVMGTVFALARQRSGAVLDPIVVHLTWSLVMLTALPPIVG